MTDKQRREVAARIKALPDDMYSRSLELLNDGILDLRAQDTADYYEIYYALFGAFPADNQHPNDFRELHKRLADLIDRPTTRDVADFDHESFKCARCGHRVLSISGNPDHAKLVAPEGGVIDFSYCPNCGAEFTKQGK